MKTPKEYNDNFKKGIITRDMLEACLYSVNKRAKNCRDKELEIRDYYRFSRYAYDKYHNEDKYRNQKKDIINKKKFFYQLFRLTVFMLKHKYEDREFMTMNQNILHIINYIKYYTKTAIGTEI